MQIKGYIQLINEAMRDCLQPFEIETKEEYQNKLGWIVTFRWFSIAAHLIAYPFMRHFSLILPEMEWMYFSSLALLILINLTAKKFQFRKYPNWYLFFQLCIDAFEFGFVLYLTGGANNPFWPLLFLYAAIGTLALEGMQRLFYAKFLSLILLAMHMFIWQTSGSPTVASSTVILYISRQTIMIALIILLTFVASSLDRLKERVAKLSEQNLKNQRMRAIGTLASGFSHEFATPLNNAKIRVSRILRKYDVTDPSMNSDLDSINESVNQCEKALKRLNQIKMDQDQVFMHDEDLSALIMQTVKLWKQNEHSEAVINIDVEKGVFCHLSGVSFCQTIFDLLDNAWDASSEKVEIDVQLVKHLQDAVVEIKDRGEGIPKEIKKNLGDPFTTSKEKGTGLGIYHAHSFADLVGGAINYFDRNGGGTIARLHIPLVAEV